MVALERLPVPALAMSRDGIIVFANAAFAEMVGYELDGLAGSAFPEIFHPVPAGEATLSGVDGSRIWWCSCAIVRVGRCEPG